MDLLTFGHRLRYLRRRADLTLAQLGDMVGRPAPYLSQLENGHAEPKLSLVTDLANALGTTHAELLDSTPPTRRAELEIALVRAQEDPRYEAMKLPYLKPSARLGDDALEHVVHLWSAVVDRQTTLDRMTQEVADPVRRANVQLREEMSQRDNYYGEIEAVATRALAAVGYSGFGPISERTLIDLAAWMGFSIDRVQDLPHSTSSITDLRSRKIYIPQRNDLPTRAARSVVLQTLGHFALEQGDPSDVADHLRQRVESNYFAAAILAPEAPAVAFLERAKADGDISIEDLKEIFYISYEMAAHRFTNLATRHLDLPVHFLRTDEEGVVWKAYENDGVPFPTAKDGSIVGQRVPANWGPRVAFRSDDAFSLHYQYTETPAGTYWCVTHVEVDRAAHTAVTVGTEESLASSFRGSDVTRRVALAPAEASGPALVALAASWDGHVWPSARDRTLVVAGSANGDDFTAFPGVEMDEVYEFLGSRSTD